MNLENLKNDIFTFCRSLNKPDAEAILKMKIPLGGYDLDGVTQAAESAVEEMGLGLEIKVTKGKNGYKILDTFTKDWITSVALSELENYSAGDITIRGLHYRLVSRGMTNSMTHYSRVKSAMTTARREGLVDYEQFKDHDRETVGSSSYGENDVESEVESSFGSIKYWMNAYSKQRWSNQPKYVEVWIEKKALIGAFERVCSMNRVILAPCKGYPSLTFLNDAAERFKAAEDSGKEIVILYFGDYDPSGEDIPRSVKENLLNDFNVDVELKRILLMEHQVVEMGLPPAPTKSGDTRAGAWDGLGQVELDSIEPNEIKRILQEAIFEEFDNDLHRELKEIEAEERKEYRTQIKKMVNDFDFEGEE